MDLKKKQELIDKYTKRIEIDYPEIDKIAIDLDQFAQEIIELIDKTDVDDLLKLKHGKTICDCPECGTEIIYGLSKKTKMIAKNSRLFKKTNDN